MGEEEEEGYGLVGRYDGSRREPPAGAPPHEVEYLATVHELVAAYSKSAKRRLRRFYTLMTMSLVSAAAVPVSVAADGHGWIIASLGAITAVCQGVQQILQDQRVGAESHAMAAALSQELRKFRYEAGATTDYRQRKVFDDLVKVVEDLLNSRGMVILETMKDQPRISAPPRT